MAKKPATVKADHGARDHAQWSASSTEPNWNCSGRLALLEQITTPEKENFAAAWGTACHQVSEKCLQTVQDAASFIGTTEKTKAHEIEVDEELCETAQVYIDYVRGRLAEYEAATGEKAVVHYEQHFSLTAALNTPFDAGGTGDTVIFFPKWRLIEVVDLKGGRGVVVEVKGNKQLRTYGLGAVIANSGLPIDKVRVTVVQPRAGHKDGIVREETFHISDLMEWTADLLLAMGRSKEAMAELGTMPLSAWLAKHTAAGDHCKFCRVKNEHPDFDICPTYDQKATDAIGLWFDDEDKPQIGKSNAPDSMTPAQLAKKLDMADMITEWLNAVRARAQSLADSGVEIYDPETDARYQLVESIGHRKFTDTDAVKEVLFLKLDVVEDELFNKKFMSPAQIEKLLGAKKLKTVKEDLAKLTTRPVTGNSLVRTTKTSRPAAKPAVAQHFSPIPD